MGDRYKVIGTCAVAGRQPGEEVTEEELFGASAQIAPLVGVHLELTRAARPKKDIEK